MTEFSNLSNLWVMEFLERAQRGEMIEGQRQQLITLLRTSESQMERFFGQIAATLEADIREEFQARLDFDLEHFRMSLARVEAAQPNIRASQKNVPETELARLSTPQAPSPPARKEEDPLQQMWRRNQEERQVEAEQFAKELLRAKERRHLENHRAALERMDAADKIARERRKGL